MCGIIISNYDDVVVFIAFMVSIGRYAIILDIATYTLSALQKTKIGFGNNCVFDHLFISLHRIDCRNQQISRKPHVKRT